MAVSYMKLWHLLLDKNMKKKDLELSAGISHYVMNKMSRGEDISTEAIRKICKALNCHPDEMMDLNFNEVD